MTEGTDKPASLRERNRLRTRQDILDAAAEILGVDGYAGATLETIGRQAGVSRGTLYAYFPGGRDEIVQEVYHRIADSVYVRGISLRDNLTDTSERIVALAQALVEATREPKGRFYGVMGPDVVAVVSKIMGSTSRSFQELIAQDLEDAKNIGLLPKKVPTVSLAAVLTGAIRAAGAATALNPQDSEQTVEAVRLLCEGFLLRTNV